MSDVILGIDLGTMDSCAAILRNGTVEIVPDKNGKNIIPSMVCYKKDNDQFLYGNFAKNNYLAFPKSTMLESKRFLASKFKSPEVQKDIKYLTVTIKEDKNTGKPKYIIEEKNGIKEYFPEEVSSMILKYIIGYCEVFNSNTKLEKAIITVPAHFNIFQREATIEAGKLAGLKEVTLLNEATAAAIAYADKFKSNEEMKILVFDIGGGTFDVSILSVNDNKYRVLSSHGISHLGGEDFNQLLLDYVIDEAKKNEDFKDVNFQEPRILKKFRNEVENKKIELSEQNEISFYIDAIKGENSFSMNITRKKYEELCMEKWKEMFPAVDEAIKLAENKLKKEQKKEQIKLKINKIIFVGGPTRTPKIEEMVKKHFPNIEILKNVNVEEVVAYGAAISGKKNLIIEDIISKSFGIEIANKEFSEIIPMGTSLPANGKFANHSRNYTLKKNNNANQKIKIYEGNNTTIKENNYLGEFNVKLDENEKDITVKMTIDQSSILKVSAVVNGKNKETTDIKIEKINY